MELRERLSALARLGDGASPVVTVYFNTRWTDEHQRERTRVFLKNALRRARETAGPELAGDLNWIETEGERLIGQAGFPDAHGVALFASHARGLRDVVPLRVPFEDAFVVADRPLLTPLAAAAEEAPPAIVVFIDGIHARLIPIDPAGRGDEVRLEHGVPGRHARGGWSLLAQSRYQRHIEAHRGRHFEAVVEALTQIVGTRGIERIVLAGEARSVAVFRKHLPPRLAQHVAGSLTAARHESAGRLVRRATALLAGTDRDEEDAAVNAVLADAPEGGRAVAGLEATLEAVNRGAVHCLYLLKTFDLPGCACTVCHVLDDGDGTLCRVCGAATQEVRLGAAITERVIATGGTVEVVGAHPDLARAGEIAGRLRYPL